MTDAEVGRDPAGLRESLTASPLLAVLRPGSAKQAERQIEAVCTAGFRHLELAWNGELWWQPFMQSLSASFPQIRFGVAGLHHADQLNEVKRLGLSFAMSPIASMDMVERAHQLHLTLVPGVFTPSEVRGFGVATSGGPIKLFPAASLGCAYWKQLSGPLGPLPFCIAAGGLKPVDVAPWLAAGVQAVALGSSLLDCHDRLLPGHAASLEAYLNTTPRNIETL